VADKVRLSDSPPSQTRSEGAGTGAETAVTTDWSQAMMKVLLANWRAADSSHQTQCENTWPVGGDLPRKCMSRRSQLQNPRFQGLLMIINWYALAAFCSPEIDSNDATPEAHSSEPDSPPDSCALIRGQLEQVRTSPG